MLEEISIKKRFTDIELDTIEAGVTLANLTGFHYNPSEAHEEQIPEKNINDNVTTTVKRGKGMRIQQNNNSIGENEERVGYEKPTYCTKA